MKSVSHLFLWVLLLTQFAAFGQQNESIQVIYPKGGEHFTIGQTITFQWQQKSDVGMYLYLNNQLIASAITTKQYQWKIPTSFETGTYQLRLLSGEGEELKVNQDIHIDQDCQLLANAEAISYNKIEAIHYVLLRPTYIKSHFHETKGNLLNVAYNEEYNQAKQGTLTAKIYGWQRNELANLTLTKHFGKNHYSIDISKLCNQFPQNEFLTLETTDENNKLHSILFKYTPAPAIEAQILMNPKYWNCGVEQGNEVEYIGNITGGQAPYAVTWYVSGTSNHQDASRTEHEDKKYSNIQKPSMSVYDQLGYYVIMHVKDACGAQVERKVFISCKAAEKAKNQISIQIINTPTTGE